MKTHYKTHIKSYKFDYNVDIEVSNLNGFSLLNSEKKVEKIVEVKNEEKIEIDQVLQQKNS